MPALLSNAPNPFNQCAAISFVLPEAQDIALTIYNACGEIVWSQKMTLSSGYHITKWDGNTQTNSRASGGIYFYELTTERTTLRKKLAFIP